MKKSMIISKEMVTFAKLIKQSMMKKTIKSMKDEKEYDYIERNGYLCKIN